MTYLSLPPHQAVAWVTGNLLTFATDIIMQQPVQELGLVRRQAG